MIMRAFEFPWTRRKRLRAWQDWKNQHWDRQTAADGGAEPTLSNADLPPIPREASNDPMGSAREEAVHTSATDLDDIVTLVDAYDSLGLRIQGERPSEVVAAVTRSTRQALVDPNDTVLAIEVLQADASALQRAGDRPAAISRYMAILTLFNDPINRRGLDETRIAQVIYDARSALHAEMDRVGKLGQPPQSSGGQAEDSGGTARGNSK
jgi:hypothetical protein